MLSIKKHCRKIVFYKLQKEGDVILLIEIQKSDIFPMNLNEFKIVIHKGTVAGLYFSNEVLREEFINRVKDGQVTNINVQLETLSLKEDYVAFKRKMDIIPDKKIESGLSCREYIYMYCMLRQGFCDLLEERLEQMMELLHISYLIEQKVGELSRGQQTLIRSIAAYLQGCKLIILQSGTSLATEKEKKFYEAFLNNYVKLKGICLVLSTKMDELKEFTQKIYKVD